MLSLACILVATAALVWLALSSLWPATTVLSLLGVALVLSVVHVLRVVVAMSGSTIPSPRLLVLLVALEVVIVALLLLLLRMSSLAATVAIVTAHLALLLLHAATLAIAIGVVVPLVLVVSLREVLSLSLH